ncbi:hypothetical protein LR007_02195 [candidate division NPL-UPA2 bacterium]|nr:hypothetical protein [candidate division NPL-UPA2 bacterium]
MKVGANLRGHRKGRWVPVFLAGVTSSLLWGRGVGTHSYNQEAQPELQVEEIIVEELEEEEQDIPVIELGPLEPLTPEERELREFRRFVRGLEEYLQEEIPLERGIYVNMDSLFRIRRVVPDLPFGLVIGNAAGYRQLRLRQVRILGPDGKTLQSFTRYTYLPSMRKEIDYLITRREKLTELLAEGWLLLEQEMTAEKRKRREEIIKEATRILYFERPGPLREVPTHGISGSLDLTPYLQEVGDEARITVEMTFTRFFIIPKRVEKDFVFTLGAPLPRP